MSLMINKHLAPETHELEREKIPFLFRNYSLYKKRSKLRTYVKNRMIELAHDNKLSVTHMLNQHRVFRDLCGEILFGCQIVDENIQSAHVPSELKQYTVRLKPYGKWGKKDKLPYCNWKLGRFASENFYDEEEQVRRYQDEYFNPVWKKDSGSLFIDVPLQDAWMALQQYGAYCTKAKKESIKAVRWRIEEVLPEGIAADDDELTNAVEEEI